MKHFLLFFLLYFTWVQADLFTRVKADRVFYKNEYMQLKGNVSIEMNKGAVTADQAEISLDKTEGFLKNNVEIAFNDGSKLNCQSARFEKDSGKVYCTVFTEDDAVSFIHADGFKMTSFEMVASFDSFDSNAQKIASIFLKGNVHIVKDGNWKVAADNALYDHLKKTISIGSDENVKDSCVYFRDNRGKIYAKRALINVKSNCCNLYQDVKMINREGPLEQYALADQVLILKNKREARFFSDKTGRVLFYDKVNRLQMSAPKLLIRNGASSDQNEVKGYGNVRFHFNDQEYDRLRQYFLSEDKIRSKDPVCNVNEK